MRIERDERDERGVAIGEIEICEIESMQLMMLDYAERVDDAEIARKWRKLAMRIDELLKQ